MLWGRLCFLGNHSRSTRCACSISSRMLQRNAAPRSPKRVERIPSTNSAKTIQTSPHRRNNGQILYEKWYSHQITRGWNAPIIKRDAKPTIILSKFNSMKVSPFLNISKSYNSCIYLALATNYRL